VSFFLTAASRTASPLVACGVVGVGRRVLRSDLDTVRLVIDVEDSLLNFVVDFSCCVDECFFDVCRRFCRRLHEDEAVLSGERLTLLPFHVPPGFQVALVSYQHDDHV